jgi:ribosomal protein S18 acetylase RimI-like enzyme
MTAGGSRSSSVTPTATGGLHGWTWRGTANVDTFWVREDLRGKGLGKRLLAAAEEEPVRRGCQVLQLSTHSYQAPGFYRRLGYEQIGELPGWPVGSTRYLFSKTLGGPQPMLIER